MGLGNRVTTWLLTANIAIAFTFNNTVVIFVSCQSRPAAEINNHLVAIAGISCRRTILNATEIYHRAIGSIADVVSSRRNAKFKTITVVIKWKDANQLVSIVESIVVVIKENNELMRAGFIAGDTNV